MTVKHTLCVVLVLLASREATSQGKSVTARQAVTVADGITMTRFAAPDYYYGNAFARNIANFSPDGSKFVFVLRKGNLKENTNEFSLVLFRTSQIFKLPNPETLLVLASSSNRDAVARVKWLHDNETIVFLGEHPGETSQLYSFNITRGRLLKLTQHPTAITNYDISEDGREIIFTADPPTESLESRQWKGLEGIVISDQRLSDLIASDYGNATSHDQQLFFQRAGQKAVRIPVSNDTAILAEDTLLELSPTGEHAIVQAFRRYIPHEWNSYQDEGLHADIQRKRWDGQISNVSQYLLVTVKEASAEALLDSPMQGRVTWAPDGASVFVRSAHLPLSAEHWAKQGQKSTYPIEVRLANKEFRIIDEKDWPGPPNSNGPVNVRVEEDMNTPPKIVASNEATHQKAVLLDLNPQFAALDLGRVETIRWSDTEGHEWKGGLYLPPNYSRTKRYPLVIQTHGFEPARFSMDGRSEWSSAFAARPLAAEGIIVLCVGSPTRGHVEYSAGIGKYGATFEEAVKIMTAAAFQSAVDYLDERGFIDRNRVGIVGFSRTVCYVAYALTHSSYPFAAATLVDGIDCGYFQYFAFPNIASDADALNGGRAPFGPGLQDWLLGSPSFRVDKIRTPVRLVALGRWSVLESWEWFVALKEMQKPVDFMLLPEATHMVVKPRECVVAQQGLVDWFNFWLKGVEDPDPTKADQYGRWVALRTKVLE